MDIEATVTSPTDKELKLRAKWLLVWLQATGYLRRGDAGPTAPLNQRLRRTPMQQTDSARSLQEVVYQRELIGREVRPIQKRKLCPLHDGSIVDLAHSPGEYCDRCVGDRVHK